MGGKGAGEGAGQHARAKCYRIVSPCLSIRGGLRLAVREATAQCRGILVSMIIFMPVEPSIFNSGSASSYRKVGREPKNQASGRREAEASGRPPNNRKFETKRCDILSNYSEPK